METTEKDVYVAIGRWSVERLLTHRAELVEEMFSAVVKRFIGYYPHHKLLSRLCQAAREPKEINPDDSPKTKPEAEEVFELLEGWSNADREVFAAVGRWSVERLLRHRASLITEMVNELAGQFSGHQSEQKLLADIAQDAKQ